MSDYARGGKERTWTANGGDFDAVLHAAEWPLGYRGEDEMSEDPVEYEPRRPDSDWPKSTPKQAAALLRSMNEKHPGSGSTEFDPSMPDLSRFDRPLSPEPTATQIKIEALRAAAVVMAGVLSSELSIGSERVDVMTIGFAEQFRKWLSES